MVYTVLAMWSRPTRIAALNVCRGPVWSTAESSNTAEAWVIVTSLSTPSAPMMNPASSRPFSEMALL